MQPSSPAAVPSPLPGLVALTLAYVLSQFFRTMLAVIAPELAGDLGLGATALGSLSALFFIAFATAQLPVGMLLDRFGPRRTVSLVMLLASAGAVVLATAGSPVAAYAGQVLIGLGCAPVFMGALYVVARRYPVGRFAVISSLLLAIGQGGVLLGASPLAMAAQALGWRGALLGVAGITLASAGLVALLVRDPQRHAGPSESLGEAFAGVLATLRLRELWPILPMSFVSYGVLVTLRGLWAGPYLADVFALAPGARGNALLGMSLAMVVGTLAYGALERRLDRRRDLVAAGTAVTVLALGGLALAPSHSLALSATLLAVVGVTGIHFAIVMAQGRRFLPDRLIGRGLTMLNGMTFAGAAVVQVGSGVMIDVLQTRGAADAAVWTALFAALGLLLAVALAAYLRSEDRRV
ncbi:MAG: MFS transporter [Geminicoccaceae bacterium]